MKYFKWTAGYTPTFNYLIRSDSESTWLLKYDGSEEVCDWSVEFSITSPWKEISEEEYKIEFVRTKVES